MGETAVENGEGTLNKEATSHGDLLDSYRLSLMSAWESFTHFKKVMIKVTCECDP